MSAPPRLNTLIRSLCCLPGIGKKSAQRIAYHLLQRDRAGAKYLARSLNEAMDNIGHCQRCRNFSETDICALCASEKRDSALLCVVENPTDVYAMEEAGYNGRYFVLMGRLSPLDGIGPQELGVDALKAYLDDDVLREVILATNSTVEGEATAHFIHDLIKRQDLRITRIAHGVPLGGELEYIDSHTLSHALAGRNEYHQ